MNNKELRAQLLIEAAQLLNEDTEVLTEGFERRMSDKLWKNVLDAMKTYGKDSKEANDAYSKYAEVTKDPVLFYDPKTGEHHDKQHFVKSYANFAKNTKMNADDMKKHIDTMSKYSSYTDADKADDVKYMNSLKQKAKNHENTKMGFYADAKKEKENIAKAYGVKDEYDKLATGHKYDSKEEIHRLLEELKAKKGISSDAPKADAKTNTAPSKKSKFTVYKAELEALKSTPDSLAKAKRLKELKSKIMAAKNECVGDDMYDVYADVMLEAIDLIEDDIIINLE